MLWRHWLCENKVFSHQQQYICNSFIIELKQGCTSSLSVILSVEFVLLIHEFEKIKLTRPVLGRTTNKVERFAPRFIQSLPLDELKSKQTFRMCAMVQ